jgi:CRP/FNR family cyclic AMP-dependent transcriptional regulator
MPAQPELLRSVHFFQTLDDDDLAMVAGLMDEARFPPGAVIFRENDPGGTLFVVSEGRVQLSIRDDDGNTILLDTLDPGEFFGEVSLLDGGSRSATAAALENEVLAFSLSRETLLSLIRRRSDVALDMVTALGRRLRKTDESLRRRVRNPNEVLEERSTLAERIADAVARFGGSWSFIISFGVVLTAWVLLNTAFLLVHRANGEPFDPYPFILLNLVLSMLAALQAPVIMMSQNRQDAKDRVRSELDYHVNVKAELEILQILERVDAMKHQIERLELPVRPA